MVQGEKMTDQKMEIGPAISSDLIRLAVAYNDALDRCTGTKGLRRRRGNGASGDILRIIPTMLCRPQFLTVLAIGFSPLTKDKKMLEACR